MKKTVKAKKLELIKATLRDKLDNQYLQALFRGALLLAIASVMAAGCVDCAEPAPATDAAGDVITDEIVVGEGSSLA